MNDARRGGAPGLRTRRTACAVARSAFTGATASAWTTLVLAGALLAPVPALAQAGNPASPPGMLSEAGAPLTLPQNDSEMELDQVGIALGLAYSVGPTFAGASSMGRSFSPAGKITWRGFTLSSSSVAQARAVSTETASRETGLTGPLVRRNRVGFGLGFALRRGRNVSNEQRAEGLRDLETTVIARLRARWFFTDDLVLSGTLIGDLLGRRGGLAVPVGLSYKHSLTRRLLFVSDVGFTWANASTISQDFGVGPEQSAASGLPLYHPSAGIRDVAASLTLIHEPFEHWVLFLRGSAVQLTGPAARSPITRRSFQPALLAGVVYRFDW